MKINQFFAEVLGAPTRNPRWSWGAVDEEGRRVFLRVWNSQFHDAGRGRERVEVYWKPPGKSPGYRERSEQLELIRSGFSAYGVLCEPVDPKATTTWQIRRFDENTLVRLGRLTEDASLTYAEVEEYVPLVSVIAPAIQDAILTEDLEAIEDDQDLESTQKAALINARVGQGGFRARVLAMWDYRCAVSDAKTTQVIRASHIRPWRDSSNRQRLDSNNGLPLVAGLDALFDAGLVTFKDDGRMLISSLLDDVERGIFGLRNLRLRKKPTPAMQRHLRFHRDKRFKG